jgi:hypothetical protein
MLQLNLPVSFYCGSLFLSDSHLHAAFVTSGQACPCAQAIPLAWHVRHGGRYWRYHIRMELTPEERQRIYEGHDSEEGTAQSCCEG